MNTQQELHSNINIGYQGGHKLDAQKMKNWMPNLIIIGALKPATSTLNYTLAKHKDIPYCSPSEPKLFGSRYNKEWDWYSEIFRKGEKCNTRIEASTKYASSEELFKRTPELIHTHTSSTNLIYLTRNLI